MIAQERSRVAMLAGALAAAAAIGTATLLSSRQSTAKAREVDSILSYIEEESGQGKDVDHPERAAALAKLKSLSHEDSSALSAAVAELRARPRPPPTPAALLTPADEAIPPPLDADTKLRAK